MVTNQRPTAQASQKLFGPFQKISIHDPSLLRSRNISKALYVIDHVPELAGHQNFIFGADIGTPIDIDVLRNSFERPVPVKHDNDAFRFVGKPSASFLAVRRELTPQS